MELNDEVQNAHSSRKTSGGLTEMNSLHSAFTATNLSTNTAISLDDLLELINQPQQQTLAKEDRIAFCLSNRAVAEAFSLAFKMRGNQVSLLDYTLPPTQYKSLLPLSLMIIDPHSSWWSNLDLLLEFKRANVPILFLTSRLKTSHIHQALKCKARGIITTQMSLSHLVRIIIKLASEELSEYWCPEAEKLMVGTGAARKLHESSVFSLLTSRQLEVLTHLAEGKTVKEVAQVMHLSQKSVDSHKYRIMTRLNIHDRVHLARLAIREGLIEA